jgi:hypothetical protein
MKTRRYSTSTPNQPASGVLETYSQSGTLLNYPSSHKFLLRFIPRRRLVSLFEQIP